MKKKPPFFFQCMRLSHVKLCAVGMRNAILRNDFNIPIDREDDPSMHCTQVQNLYL